MTQDVTEDGFLGGRLVLRQQRFGYRAGGDPVFLAAAVSPKPGSCVLDMGAGVGTVGLCLARRVPDITIVGLELQADLAQLAQTNAQINGLEARYRMYQGDVLSPPSEVLAQRFQMVVTNPPWTESGTGTPPPAPSKSIGHMEGEVDLTAWIKAAAALVENKGWVATIHRADRLSALFAAYAKAHIGDIRVTPLYAHTDKPAIRIIMQGRKGVKSPTQLLPPLTLHDEDGGFTAAARAVLEHGKPL